MAHSTDTDPQAPPAPALLAPTGARVVDAAAVTFAWKPVEGADAYRFEVAADTDFETRLVEQEFGGRTSLTVANFFEANQQTYYWRVLARNAAGWSSGERIESFVAAGAEQARQVAPEDPESLGPAVDLVKSDARAVASDLTGDYSQYADEEDGVEHDRVETGQIAAIAVSVLAALVVVIILVFQWTGLRAQHSRQAQVGLSGYPELRENRARGLELLSGYGVADPDRGAYRIPIDRAIDLVVQERGGAANTSPAPEPQPRSGN